MKLVVIHRKLLTILACLAASVLMFTLINHPAIVGASASARQLPIYCVQRDQKMISIPFDAAWGDVSLRQSGSA